VQTYVGSLDTWRWRFGHCMCRVDSAHSSQCLVVRRIGLPCTACRPSARLLSDGSPRGTLCTSLGRFGCCTGRRDTPSIETVAARRWRGPTDRQRNTTCPSPAGTWLWGTVGRRRSRSLQRTCPVCRAGSRLDHCKRKQTTNMTRDTARCRAEGSANVRSALSSAQRAVKAARSIIDRDLARRAVQTLLGRVQTGVGTRQTRQTLLRTLDRAVLTGVARRARQTGDVEARFAGHV
jgi:hypothetical protein